MATEPHIKLTAELSIEDGDLLLAITDGYGKFSILRYRIPQGGGEITFYDRDRTVKHGVFRLKMWSWNHYVLSIDAMSIAVPQLIAVEIAEILLGGPIPDAPHQCAVSGCDHGHAA